MQDDRFPSRGLVSSIYRLGPSDDGYMTDWEKERRLKVMVQRLVSQHGQAPVVERVRAGRIGKDQEAMRGWIVLTAQAAAERQRSGSF